MNFPVEMMVKFKNPRLGKIRHEQRQDV